MAQISNGELTSFLESMITSAKDLSTDQLGTRGKLLNQAYELISKLDTPSECIQRMGWAEVKLLHLSVLIHCKELMLWKKSLLLRDVPGTVIKFLSLRGISIKSCTKCFY